MDQVISNALTAAQQSFRDTRFHLCRLEAESNGDGHYLLTGTVLDQRTLDTALSCLRSNLPDIQWSSEGVCILRHPQPRMVAVTANLTGWQREPSWLAEQQSQVLSGTLVEALDENERWTFGRLADGYLGWVYTAYTGVPDDGVAATHRVVVPVALLRREPDDAASLAGRVFAGTRVAVGSNAGDWAEVTQVGSLRGFVPIGELRSLEETPDPVTVRTRLIREAMPFIGVPYLWGGGSINGIDCSGFAQLMHKLAGIVIPRDADVQFSAGQPVAPPFLPGDLLFFGSPGDHRDVSHVGISLGSVQGEDGMAMIHSSRSRNGVYIDDINTVESLRKSFLGGRRFIT